MFHRIKTRSYSIYRSIISSIAFYPAMISALMLILAFAVLSVEDSEFTKYLNTNADFLLIKDTETARSILSTLIGGIISLTVFSFSMVMVLLNQASTNFSPRLLPGLISDKKHQIVLGIYLGTILYNIMVMISITPSANTYMVNGFSVLVGIIFGILSLAMFVFFIHNISTEIQINNIIDTIYLKTKSRLEYLKEAERKKHESLKVDDKWITIKTKQAGYFQEVNVGGIREFVASREINLKVIPIKGMYILNNSDLFMIDRSLSEEDMEILVDMAIFSNSNDVAENYILGLRQITEIGIKAMSPGINDPGTAIMTLDYLTELLAIRMQVDNKEIFQVNDSRYTIELAAVTFEQLMYQTLAAYRQYCKHDIIVMEKIVTMLTYLLNQKTTLDCYLEVLKGQMNIMSEDIKDNIQNSTDKEKLLALISDNKKNPTPNSEFMT